MARLTLLLFVLFLAIPASAQTVIGRWQTIDDNLNEPRSIVEIYEEEGEVRGRIVEVFLQPGEPEDPVCQNCPDDKADQPIEGLEFMWGFEQDSDTVWGGGRILDPENGKVYRCRLTLQDDGRLSVRGYVGIRAFGRTQTWLPAD